MYIHVDSSNKNLVHIGLVGQNCKQLSSTFLNRQNRQFSQYTAPGRWKLVVSTAFLLLTPARCWGGATYTTEIATRVRMIGAADNLILTTMAGKASENENKRGEGRK